MIEVRGKFITLVASLMSLYKDAFKEADRQLYKETGRHWNELEPEGWYDAKFYKMFGYTYRDSSPSGDNALITLGKQIYPTIKRTVGLPANLKTPIDYLEFEAEGYLESIRGPGITTNPRTFVRKTDGYVIIQTTMTEPDCKIIEGVYMGIMKMAGVNRGKVYQEKCIKNGDNCCEFHIIWKPLP
jgi:hypothetical protein